MDYYGYGIPTQVSNLVVFSGSFNPLHRGHLHAYHTMKDYIRLGHTMFDIDEQGSKLELGKFYKEPQFEIAKVNSDKGLVDNLAQRVKQFEDIGLGVLVTTSSTFVSKAFSFPKCVFVIGDDTIYRVLDLKYYCNCERTREQAFDIIRERGCQFIVLPRNEKALDIHKKLVKYTGLLHDLVKIDFDFEPINISSTEIREKKNEEQ